MAVTKIWAIKDSLQRVLDYAANPDKTEYDALAQTLHYAENDAKTKLNESAQLVTGIHCRVGAAYSIIAPFNREQNATRHDKSKNAFREDIMQSLEFKNTVDYVLENSPEKGNLSRDVVEEAYGRLIDEYYTVMEESTDKARLHIDE